MGAIKPGPYSSPHPEKGHITLLECVIHTGMYVPGDQIYYKKNYYGTKTGIWKEVNKNTCHQSKEYLDSQYSGNTCNTPTYKYRYLLQRVKESDFGMSYGDRVWHFTYPGEDINADTFWWNDWILVDVYNAPDAG